MNGTQTLATKKKQSEGSRTVGRVLRLLELLAGDNKAMRLVDIARTLELPVSSIHVLLGELLKYNYLTVDEGDNRYKQSSGLVLLANRVLAGTQLTRAAKPVLESLGAELNESVYIGMSHASGIIYVDTVERTYGLLSRLPLGVPRPSYASSSGMVFLAYHVGPEMLASAIANLKLQPITEHTVVDPTKLKTMIHTVIEQGYAINDQAVNDAVCGVSAPIFFHDRSLAGTVTVSIPEKRFRGREGTFIEPTVAAAHAVSRNLGAHQPEEIVQYYRNRLATFSQAERHRPRRRRAVAS